MIEARCKTCPNSTLWGERGVCRRPDAGMQYRKPLTDPFLPNITADMGCGSHPDVKQDTFGKYSKLYRRSKWR